MATSISEIVLSSNPDLIVEIGPGTGVFTNLFSKNGVKVLAIEKDSDLSQILTAKFLDNDVEIINQDFMESDLINNLGNSHKNITIFGSLPYNQSKRIIAKTLKEDLFTNHYYIIQKEVAQKYVDDVDSNRLSIYSSIFAKRKILLAISPSNFKPQPKVKSSLIHFSRYEEKVAPTELKRFESFINLAFNKPRKKVRNNLPKIKEETERSKILYEQRPSNLTLDDYIYLYDLTSIK